ncbi:MAG: hypothetical protein NVS4B3_24020 [Gemmatimonadaceae bacterium]
MNANGDPVGLLRHRHDLEKALGTAIAHRNQDGTGRRWTTLRWPCGCGAEERVTDLYRITACAGHGR